MPLILARATGFSDEYQLIFEAPAAEMTGGREVAQGREVEIRWLDQTSSTSKGQQGGGVFSVGSIAWCGSLSHNNYSNNVSRITKNVLDRFSSDVPIV